MVDGILGDLGQRIITMALTAWREQEAVTQEIHQFRHIVEAAVRLIDPDERRQQVRPLLIPLQGLLHRVGRNHEQAYAVHLALAAAYMAVGEEVSQLHHLNRACDCAIRVMQETWWATTRATYRRLRDELLALLGERREVLIG